MCFEFFGWKKKAKKERKLAFAFAFDNLGGVSSFYRTCKQEERSLLR